MTEDRGNEFFGHLDSPATPTPRKLRRPTGPDFSSVPDPFGDEAPQPPGSPPSPPRGTPRPAARPPSGQVKGPGLSPGIPRINQTPTREVPRSGVVLTPGGVKRVDDQPKPPPTPEPEPEVIDAAQAEDFHQASRKANEKDDVSWEEYAASDFPAMAAEEFGVKTKTTDSGRVVPVAVRPDLTEEAMKGKSVKDKGRTRRPTAKVKQASAAPRSFMQRIGDSLRMKRPQLEDTAETSESEESAAEGDGGAKGFAKSGSQQGKARRRKKSPGAMAWNVVVEVTKIFLLVLLLRAYVVQVSQVQGPSMEPTLLQDDRLVVERITPLIAGQKKTSWVRFLPGFLHPELKRGDIVVVRSPEDPGAELVKRLIALPGDTLKFEDGHIYLKSSGADDFALLEEPYLQAEDLKNEDGSFRSYGVGDLGNYLREGQELTVPEERLFLMGDNRNRSNDSRRWLQIGVNVTDTPGVDRLWVHKSSVEGVVIFRIFPFDRVWPPVK